MKKIYAKELDPEFYNYEMYYSEDDAESDLFCAYGNRHFRDLNNYRADYAKKLEECKYDIDVISDEVDDESTAEELDVIKEEILNTVRYYFKPEGSRVLELTDLELDDLMALCDEFYGCGSNEEDDIICRALEICYGFKFKTGYIQGCCQGDWMKYMCPETLSQEAIDYIEAVLFASGTEFMMTDRECESLEEAEAAFDNGDCYSVYTAKWQSDAVKEDLASQCYGNYGAEDIVLLTIKKRHMQYSYDYEEQ